MCKAGSARSVEYFLTAKIKSLALLKSVEIGSSRKYFPNHNVYYSPFQKYQKVFSQNKCAIY